MKFNFSHIDISKGLSQIPEAFKVLIDTPAFIIKHKLWKGFLDHSWVFLFSIIIATLFSYILYNDVYSYFIPDNDEGVEINISTEGIDQGIKAIEEAIANSSDDDVIEELEEDKEELLEEKEELEEKGHKPLFSGSLKFLLLMFLEVLIFHFSVKTNNILKNKNKVLEFKEFYNAQIRMIKVIARKWIYGLIMYILISIICGITGAGYFKESIMFMIYGYYLGFAFFDNYLEQFHFSIKESATCIQSHFGASTVFGVFASILMNVPLIGPLFVPFLCAIAAARYGHNSQMESFSKARKVAG